MASRVKKRTKKELPKHTYFLSWISPCSKKEFEYHGPWWITGMDCDMNDIMVGAIKASSPEEAVDVMRKSYDNVPETLQVKFCNMLPDEQCIFSDTYKREQCMVWPIDSIEAELRKKKAIAEREANDMDDEHRHGNKNYYPED